LNCGDVAEARRFIEDPGAIGESSGDREAWMKLHDITTWPDAWLVAAVRCDPPDAEALDTLAHRYWKPLFGRCELLTLHHQKACDLAQEAWRKVLRSRTALKPGGNFPAYLNTVATNIWRDWHRASRRAGAMAEDQLASLDAAISNDDGSTIVLGDVIPDLKSMGAEEQRLLMLDIDHALERLEPHLREVLVARFLNEESCAEIGRRHGRTEQTISAWVREGVRQMKRCIECSRCSGGGQPQEKT
jgi:RNA polymerase sigma-70 factor (ECF subfamily)